MTDKKPTEGMTDEELTARYTSPEGAALFLKENVDHEAWFHITTLSVHAVPTEKGISVDTCELLDDVAIALHYMLFSVGPSSCSDCGELTRKAQALAAGHVEELTHDNVDAIEWKQ